MTTDTTEKRKPVNETTKAHVLATINAEKAKWDELTPEQKTAKLEQDRLDRQAEEDRRSMVNQDQLDAVLGAFSELAKTAKVMTPQEEAAYTWEHRTRPTMASLGLRDKQLIRITDWNNERQEMTFEGTKALCGRGRGAIILLAGERGAGKTTIVAQIMRERIEAWNHWNDTPPDLRRGPLPHDPGRYEKLGILGAMFKPLYADFGNINTERLRGLLEVWSRVPLLALDEIHESEDIKVQMRFLTDLCDRRYAAGFDTILISNRAAKDFTEKGEVLSPSIISRISEAGKIFPCEWGSWRPKIAAQYAKEAK